MKNKEKVAVIGLGYVGLPLAALCALKGHDVTGYDTNQKTINTLQSGKCHIKDQYLEQLLEKAIETSRLLPSNQPESIKDCNIYLVCVPTPTDSNNDPDLGPLVSAIKSIAPFLSKGDLLIVESTVFPGTCEEQVIPMLEQYCQLTVSKDFDLAYCPERINPGDAFWSIENIPRVIGATSVEGANRAANFYTGILDGEIFHVSDIRRKLRPKFKFEDNEIKVTQMPLGSVTIMNSIRDTEAVKVMENTVRDVNIALVNELAKISDVLSLDVVDIIDGMSTKPFGKGPFFPGAGVGGHCIAVDPEWLKSASSKAGYMPEMINLARLTNNSMPEYTVSLLQDLLNQRGYPLKNTDVTLLGVAYKRNVDDPRESPFYSIRSLLQKKLARITVYDSWYRIENNVESLELALKNVKAVIIITDHNDIVKALSEMNLQATNIEVIIDGRNCLDSEQISRQGVSYHGVGRK